MNMKILHICTMDYNGAGKSALRLHLGLKSMGGKSKMLVLYRRSQGNDIVQFEGCNSIFSRMLNRVRTSFELSAYRNTRVKDYDLFTNSRSIYNVSRHPLVKEADIITLRWIAYMVDYREFFSNLDNKPLIWRLSDMNPFTGGCHYSSGCTKYQTGCGSCPQLGSKNPNDLSRKIFKRKEDAYRDHNIHIVAISKWHAACVKKSLLFKNCTIDIIPNGVPVDIFKKRDRHFSRDRFNLPQNKTLILFGADSKTERKGFRCLIEALKLLKQKIDPSTIAVVTFGPKQDPDILFKDIAIYQLGYIRDEALLSFAYSSCDMFIMPSLEEAFGQTFLESMACGTPPIGFNTGGMSDIITPCKTGLLIEVGNVEELGKRIEYMINHPKERQEMGRNARKLVEQEFSLQTQAKSYIKLYNSIDIKSS